MRHFYPVPGDIEARLREPDGGFTWQPALGYEASEGFAVAIYPGRSLSCPDWQTARRRLGDYVAWNHHLLANPDNFLGAWHDPATGKVVLDVSVVVPTRLEAEQLAWENHQDAIFDFAAGKSIPVAKREAVA